MSASTHSHTLSQSQQAVQRRSSRMAGGFEPESDPRDEVASQHSNEREYHSQDSDSLLPPQIDQPSSLLEDSRVLKDDSNPLNDGHTIQENNTALEEEEMHKRLAEFESSFVPELSTLSGHTRSTDLSGNDHSVQETGSEQPNPHAHLTTPDLIQDRARSPATPVAGYKTPAPEAQEAREKETQNAANTSALERMSSSPTAARTVSRVQSLASLGGYETAAEPEEPDSPTKRKSQHTDLDATPRKNDLSSSLPSLDTSTTIRANAEDAESTTPLNIARRRPQYLTKRSSNARLSYDSMASSTTETSEATLGADFALQSGGAASESHKLRRKPNMTLSRSTSLGSLASGVSNTSDDEGAPLKKSAAIIAPELSTLLEESPTGQRAIRLRSGGSSANIVTPRASTNILAMPTDSVIANHVRDISVPDTIARKFRSESRSPEKNYSMATMTPGPKKGLTLKEHRSTVEKLGKENFDLKMKIHFLDQALQKRSDDGVKEMITENVQLKSDRLRLEKDNHGLKKQIRELQRKLDEATGKNETEDQGYATDEERSPTVEEEVLYLRERVEVTEIELEKMRHENMTKETEKRRLAEMVRNLGDSRPGASEVGSREERDMWKDMLEAETIAREQAEDDARRLKEDLAKLRQESLGAGSRPGSKLRVIGGQIVSRPNSVVGTDRFAADHAELERLRHECSELQKTIGAQASALTSRNREKEMLYQEIENLKLGRMGGVRSIAGDSILDRSASRARSNSRASNGTKYTRMSDNERESLEVRIDQLRDELSQIKLDKQHLQSQFDEALAELDAVDQQAQADADQFNQELALLTQERDNALRDADEQDQAFQQLKVEAQEEIDGLGDELDAKIDEYNRLQEEFKAHQEGFVALQSEMRSAAEGLVRLEQDSQQNNARYQSVKTELEDALRELEAHRGNYHEAGLKVERLTVQQESSRNEIAFLREEQDADKIKISDLESLLKKTHLNLDAERDRARDFERRLTDERHQREIVANQDMQDMQRMVNELNREASSAKDELRRARKALSARELEVSTHQERINHMEDSLRHIVNDPTATSAHLLAMVSRMHKDLEQATMDLDVTRNRLDEHKRLLANRDMLLEDSATESKKMSDMLERERQNRRQDNHAFEQALKSHEAASRLVSANNARLAELEQARQAHRRQLQQIEVQYKDHLAERNQVLLTIWRKMAAMCGPDWAHNHSLINGNLPSQEVIGNTLFWPGFSRNLLLAAKQVEGVISGFKEKIKTIERDLTRDFKTLEKEFETRSKKLERIEESWEKMKLREREVEAGFLPPKSSRSRSGEVSKLKNENKLLRAELNVYQRHDHNYASDRNSYRAESRGSEVTNLDGTNGQSPNRIPHRGSSMRRSRTANQSVTLSRNNSDNISAHSQQRPASMAYSIAQSNHDAFASNSNTLTIPASSMQLPPNGNFALPPSDSSSADAATQSEVSKSASTEGKWIHRLRELERRLKHEREQRLDDRAGMRSRLEERDVINENLRKELEMERAARGWKEDHAAITNGSIASEEETKTGDGRFAEASAYTANTLNSNNNNNGNDQDFEDDQHGNAEPPSFSRRRRPIMDEQYRTTSSGSYRPISMASSHDPDSTLHARSAPAMQQQRQEEFSIERDPSSNPARQSDPPRTASRASRTSRSPSKRTVRENIASPPPPLINGSRTNSIKKRPDLDRTGSTTSSSNGNALREVMRTTSAMGGLGLINSS